MGIGKPYKNGAPDPFHPLHDTAWLYTDASVKTVRGVDRIGHGIVGRCGGRLIAISTGSTGSSAKSSHAEADALLQAIRICLDRRSTIRRIEIRTDDITLASIFDGGPVPPWMETYAARIRWMSNGRRCRISAIHVKGHTLAGPHGAGNALAHHLAFLGRIGDEMSVDIPHARDWLEALRCHDGRLDHVPLPSYVDTGTIARHLGVSREIVLRLLAAGHLIWNHEHQGVRRNYVERVKRAMLALERGTVDEDGALDDALPAMGR